MFPPPSWSYVVLSEMTPALLLVAGAAVVATVATRIVRHHVALRAYGSVHMTRDDTLALMEKHRGLRTLAGVATALQLLTGGLVIAVGIWVMFTGDTAPLIDSGLLH
jgi:hypothetical protein